LAIRYYKEPTVFQKDFYESKDGGVWLTFKPTPFLAETLLIWANKIEPVIEQL
jgi:hypothetical protein